MGRGKQYDWGVMGQRVTSQIQTPDIVNTRVRALPTVNQGPLPNTEQTSEVMSSKFNAVSSDSDCGWAGVCDLCVYIEPHRGLI